jgi:hypothetical protein
VFGNLAVGNLQLADGHNASFHLIAGSSHGSGQSATLQEVPRVLWPVHCQVLP